MKGRTRWYPRSTPPARPGAYECFARIAGGAFVIWPDKLHWDGTGFLVPFPMVVKQWRGLTKKAHAEALKTSPLPSTTPC